MLITSLLSGIVRAIDLEKKLFYVITPTPSSELSKVTIFARVTDLPVPQVLVEAQVRSLFSHCVG